MAVKKITIDELSLLACKFGLTLALVQTVYDVETNGSGFLSNGNPKILFERHKFSLFTKGVYDATHPDISNKKSGGYSGTGLGEWARFDKAKRLNKNAAIMASSWGAGQVMGYHYDILGFTTPQDFVNQNWKGEYEQFEIMLRYITLPDNKSMLTALKNKQWVTFAKLYNGPKYAENDYHTKLSEAYTTYSKLIA